MDQDFFHERFGAAADKWRHRLHKYRLDGIIGALLDVAEPFSIFGAQMLYVFQPTLGLLVRRDILEDWATLLETPGGLAWFRQQLTEQDDGK